MRIRNLGTAAIAMLLASCVAPKPAAPPPPPPSTPKPAPATPPPADWRDLPLATGEWTWSEGVARFGPPGAVLFALACEPGSGTIMFTAKGAAAPGSQASLTITASDGVFAYPATAGDGGIVARTPATDPNLAKLAFSRGRFAIAAPTAGLQQTLLPARPEIGRVIEDCRR